MSTSQHHTDAPWPQHHPTPPQPRAPLGLRRALRFMMWRGRMQGILLTALLIFFPRFLLMAAGVVIMAYAAARLLTWRWRRRHERHLARRREAWRMAQVEPPLRAQPHAPALELTPGADGVWQRPTPAEDPVEARMREGMAALDDFTRRLEEAVGGAAGESVEQAAHLKAPYTARVS